MKKEYTVIFTTDDDNFDKKNIRVVTFESTDRKDKDWVKKEANKNVTMNNIIDPYSLRNNYWIPAICEVEVKDTPWNDVYELSDYLTDNYGAKIINITSNRNQSMIQCSFEDDNTAIDVKNKLISKYGNVLPIGVRGRNLEISLHGRVELDVKNVDKVKQIIDTYDNMSTTPP